MAVEGQGWRA